MDARPVVEDVIEHWRAQNVSFLPGVNEADIAAFERERSVTVPDDLRAFYRRTNGTRAFGCDRDGYDFWAVADIVPYKDHAWALVFADYLMESWSYGIDLTGTGGFGIGAVYVLGTVGGRAFIVARTFGEFLRRYLNNDERLIPDYAEEYHARLLASQ